MKPRVEGIRVKHSVRRVTAVLEVSVQDCGLKERKFYEVKILNPKRPSDDDRDPSSYPQELLFKDLQQIKDFRAVLDELLKEVDIKYEEEL